MANDTLTLNEILESLEEAVNKYEKRKYVKEHPLVLIARGSLVSQDAFDQALEDWCSEAADEITELVEQLADVEGDDDAEAAAADPKKAKH